MREKKSGERASPNRDEFSSHELAKSRQPSSLSYRYDPKLLAPNSRGFRGYQIAQLQLRHDTDKLGNNFTNN